MVTQKALAMLFGVQIPAISKHLKNIFESQELEEKSVISILETTAEDGKNYETKFYRLEAILAVGYSKIQDQLFESDFDRAIKKLNNR